jgi:hypothetical protein
MQNIFQAKNSSTESKVKSYCIELKNRVQLATEEAIMQINNHNEDLIKKIDEYGNECLDSFEINEEFASDLNKFLEEMKLFENEWSQYLNKAQIDDEILGQVNERAVNLLNKAKEEKSKLDDLNFCGYKLAFKRNDVCHWPKFIEYIFLLYLIVIVFKYLFFIFFRFGLLSSESFKSLSSSILTDFQMLEILTLCQFEFNQDWSLVYRASQDGFEASKFHMKCDSKSNTFIIIKSTNGFVFGGYTEQVWSGNK